jgi:hypothetical protein
LWNKLAHNTIYCVKVRKKFVDIKNIKKHLSTRKYKNCEKECEQVQNEYLMKISRTIDIFLVD